MFREFRRLIPETTQCKCRCRLIDVPELYRVKLDVLDASIYSLNELHFNTPPDSTSAIPEPGTFVLLGVGVLGLVGLRRKLKK